MTHRDVACLTFRAISLYALITALEQTEWILYRWPRAIPENYDVIWMLVLCFDIFTPFFLLLICSRVLWMLAPRLSNKMFAEGSNTSSSITLYEAKSVVFLAIGLYLIVDTISPLIQTASSIYASLTGSIDPSSQANVTILRISTTIKIIIGLSLVFGSKGLANILRNIRG